jgi:hypothetical protein
MPVAALLATVASAPLQAGNAWQHEVAPYLFAAGMDGTAGVGSVIADVDVSFGDILENLEWGAMLAYRGTKGPWSISVDGIYMDLDAEKTGPQGAIFGKAEMQQIAIAADIGYAVAEQAVVFAGLRYNELDADVLVRGSGPLGVVRTAGGSESWVDPVLGARGELPVAEHWWLGLRGDIGGFGVGSDFAWQAVGSVRWQATPTIAVLAAYRYFDQDYEDGSGSDAFLYDVAASGPCLGVSFRF